MKAFVNEVYAALGRAIACSLFMFITVFCAVGEELSFALPESNDGLPGEGPIRRYEWFQNLWISRRALWADTAEADRVQPFSLVIRSCRVGVTLLHRPFRASELSIAASVGTLLEGY